MRTPLRTLAGTLGLALLTARPAAAQLAIGPLPYRQVVNGVPVTVVATSLVTVQPAPGGLAVRATVDGDLFDLQQKIGTIVDTFPLPADNCANRGVDKPNPVVMLSSKSLASSGSQAMLAVGGHVDVWSCVVGPPKTEFQWQMKRVGPIKTKVPVPHTWTNLVKNKDATQPFDASLPVSLVPQTPAGVAVQLGQPDIRLGGQYAALTNGALRLAGVDINRKAQEALQAAIDPNRLRLTLPTELQALDMTVQSAGFRNEGGHLVAEITLAATVTGPQITGLLRQIQAAPGRSP